MLLADVDGVALKMSPLLPAMVAFFKCLNIYEFYCAAESAGLDCPGGIKCLDTKLTVAFS